MKKTRCLFLCFILWRGICLAQVPEETLPGHYNLVTQHEGIKNKLVALTNDSLQRAFLEEFSEKFQVQLNHTEQYRKATDANIDDWEAILFDTRKEQNAFFKNHKNFGRFSGDFKTLVEQQIRYHYWHLIVAYPIVRSNTQKEVKRVESLPTVMLEDLNTQKISDETGLLTDSFREFLSYYIAYQNSKEHNFQKYADLSAAFQDKAIWAKAHLSGQVYAYALARLLYEYGEKIRPSELRNWYGQLGKLPQGTAFAEILKPQLAVALLKKEEPVVAKKADTKKKEFPANVFTMTNQKGETVSLEEYKGKVVYIDFWASWCGPCRAEFPHSKTLHEKLTEKQHKEVVFLYISIDATEDGWKKTVENYQQKGLLKGEQGWSQGEWNSRAAQFFGLQGIPRYVLVNKKGEIADMNAKRPSSGEAILSDIVRLIDEK